MESRAMKYLIHFIDLAIKKGVSICLIAAIGGCGGSASYNLKEISYIELNNKSVNTNPYDAEENGKTGSFRIDLQENITDLILTTEITFIDYFAKNPNGHFAIALKVDKNALTYVEGQGIAMGNLTGTKEGASFFSTVQIENWSIDRNEVLRATEQKISDNIKYKLMVHAKKNDTRYVLYQGNILLKDTGYIATSLVNNGPRNGILLAYVFSENTPDWRIVVENSKIEWY
jgi:hypothetical protein